MGDWVCSLVRTGWKASPEEPLFPLALKEVEDSGNLVNKWASLRSNPTVESEGSFSQTGLDQSHQEGPPRGRRTVL